MLKKLFFFITIIIFSYKVINAETLIINIKSKYNDGYAMLGVYNKKDNFGKAKVNEKPNPVLR